MKIHYIIYIATVAALTSCDLVSPGEVENPNVETSDFVQSTDAMKAWVNGVDACFGTCISKFAEYGGILSDDMQNTSSRSSKTYDVLDILYTDNEVSSLSTRIGEMIEMTDFGLETVAENDPTATAAQRWHLTAVKAVALLLGAENFVALPREARGEVLESQALVQEALRVLQQGEADASTEADQALLALLRARAYRLAGEVAAALEQADRAIRLAPELLLQVQFDALNGFENSVQEYVAGGLFSILPRLVHQKVKCPQAGLYEQPIAYAKIEEAYLVKAEAETAQGKWTEAQATLSALLNVIAGRDATVTLTTVTSDQVEAATTREALLTVIYLLRQETFFAEGRRQGDMGIRLPLSEVEFKEQGNLPESYTLPLIPAYLQEIRTSIDQHEDLNERMVKGGVCPFVE